MRIAEICLNSSLGGLELYYFWCCRYFKSSSHELTAVTVPHSRLEALLKEEKIDPVLIKKSGFSGRVRAAYRLARLFEQKRIDVAHVHFAKDLPIVALAKTLSRHKVRVVHTRQMEMPGRKKDVYHRWVYSKIDHILCVTEKLKRDVQARVPMVANKISRLYYGVPKPTANLEAQRLFLAKFPSERPKVAMFSRLEQSKGQYRVIEALHMLRMQGFDFQLYLFGHFMANDGYEEQLKSQIAKYNLTDSIHWCGFQKNPGELMSCFDLIILPSDQETFGLVLIEAMAAGVAILGSNTGGVPEIIENGTNGFTFDPNDTRELSSKIKGILTDNNQRDLFIAAGLRKYEELFRADQHFAALENTLKGLPS